MFSAGSGFLLLICGFSGNSEFQQGRRLQNVVFQASIVALEDGFADVLGYGQQEELTGHFDISAGQESDKPSIVLQLTEGTL